MNDIQELIEELRKPIFRGPNGVPNVFSKAADALEALNRENEALAASMTTEWGTLYEATHDDEWIEAAASESSAREMVADSPTDTSLRKRLVGPWVEVSS